MNPTFVPYFPIQLPANLKFIDSSGNPVSQLYPTAATAQQNNPQNSALSLNLAATNTIINQINEINVILNNYQITLNSLQTQITAIQTSGATAIPQVNGYCLNGNTVVPINVATALLISNTCQYNSILGTPTALASSVLAECNNLNTSPAFSQNSTMSGLVGWQTTPTTIAAAVNNIWLTNCDSRAGITKALAAVTPTCSQVIVGYEAIMNDFSTGMNFYFQGYTFVPDGYTDNGSNIQITDNGSNILLQNINIITLSNTPGAYVVNTSGSTLSPTSPFYNITVNSNVVNASLGLTCQKTTLMTVANPASATPVGPNGQCRCPNIGNYTAIVTSGVTSIPIITSLSYMPRMVTYVPKNFFTGQWVGAQVPYLTYTLGGAFITIGAIGAGGTIDIDWIAWA